MEKETVVSREEVARRLRLGRERKQWSQVKLADEGKVSQELLSRWERSHVPSGACDLVRVGLALEMYPDDLFLADVSSRARARAGKLTQKEGDALSEVVEALIFMNGMAATKDGSPILIFRDHLSRLNTVFAAQLEGNEPGSPESEPLPLTGPEVAALRQDLLAFQLSIPMGSDGAKRARTVKHWLDRLSAAQRSAAPKDTAQASPAPGESRASAGAAPEGRPPGRKTPRSGPSSRPPRKKKK